MKTIVKIKGLPTTTGKVLCFFFCVNIDTLYANEYLASFFNCKIHANITILPVGLKLSKNLPITLIDKQGVIIVKVVKLKAIEDNVSGEIGLVLAKLNILDDEPMTANEGHLIAHDLLEHVNGVQHIGGIGDELEALGACWFIRGQFNDLSRKSYGSNYSPEENIAADIVNMGVKFIHGARFDKPVPNTRKSDKDDSFEIMIEVARKRIPREMDSYDNDEDNEADYTSRLNEYLRGVTHFLRTGYRKAVRKYKIPHGVNTMFWTIAEAIDKGLKYYELFEGATFTLHYSEHKAYLEEDYGDYAY